MILFFVSYSFIQLIDKVLQEAKRIRISIPFLTSIQFLLRKLRYQSFGDCR